MENYHENEKQASINRNKLIFESISNKKMLLGWLIILPIYFFPIGKVMKPILQVFHVNVKSSDVLLAYNYGLDLIYIIALLFLWKEVIVEAWKQICSAKKTYIFMSVMQGFLFVNVFRFLFSPAALVFIKKGHELSANQSLLNFMGRGNPIFAAIMMCFFAPFIEELIFRGIIYRGLRRINVPLGIVLTSLVFTLLHLKMEIFAMDFKELLPRIFLYLGLALGLTLFYEWKKNIILNMWIHMMINMLAVIPILLIR